MVRRMKWALAAAGIVVLMPILAGLWFWRWERQSRLDLDAQVEQIRASGAPVYVSDLIPPEVPDEENAALSLRAAAAVLEADRSTEAGREAWELLQSRGVRPPLREDELSAIRGLMERNGEVWSHLEEARRREEVRWPIEYTSPMMLMPLPDLPEQRGVAQFMEWAAYLAHHEGDDSLALQRLEYLPFIAEAVDQLPTIVSHLVSIGIWRFYCEATILISHETRISDDVSTNQVRSAIGRLLDDQILRAGIRHAFEEERVSQLDTFRTMLDGSFTEEHGPARGRERRVLLSNAPLMLKRLGQFQETVEGSSDWPTFHRNLPFEIPEWVEESDDNLVLNLLPSYRRAAQSHYAMLTDRRMAACALAVRWYWVEHEGRLPGSLEELVPRYLPAVPLDPMDPEGGPIRYRPDADEPVLYSVGTNGIDDGGSSEISGGGWGLGVVRWGMEDAVVHLTRQPRREVVEEAWDYEDLLEQE